MESRAIFRSLLILLVIALMVLIAVVFLSGDQDNRTAQSTQPTAESVVATIWSDPKNRIIMVFIGVIIISLISLYKAARRTSNPGRARLSCLF